MNDNTTKLLEQLAQKLGTTTEYLWRILVSQAPLAATIETIQLVLILISGWVLYKLHRKFMRTHPQAKENGYRDNYNYYDEHAELIAVPMIIGVITFGILLILSICDIENIINGYFHPEYWALKEIISQVK